MAKDRAVDMTEGGIFRRMVAFAFPLFLGNLFQQLYNTVDALIVGNVLGSNALAAVASTGNLINMLIGFVLGTGAGAGVIVAGFYGAKDETGLSKSIHTVTAFGIIAGIAMSVFGVVSAPQVLEWTGVPDEVMPNAVAYIRTFFAGSVFLVMYNISVGVLQAVGDSRNPLIFLIISSIVNIVLDILFLTVFDMGVAGAALATVIAMAVSMILCMVLLMKTDGIYRLRLSKIRIHGDMLKSILRFGLPTGVQNAIISFSNVLVQSRINMFGTEIIAGSSIFDKIHGIMFLPVSCLGMAITTFIGQNIGARNFDRTKRGANLGLTWTFIGSMILSIITFVFAPQLVGLFSNESDVIRYGVEKTHLMAFFLALPAMSNTFAAIIRGAGKSFSAMMILLICWCAFRVIYLFTVIPVWTDIYVLYLVYPISWLISTIVFLIYFRRIDWHEAYMTITGKKSNA